MFTSTSDMQLFESEETGATQLTAAAVSSAGALFAAAKNTGATNDSIAAGLDEIARLLPQEPRHVASRRALKLAAGLIRGSRASVKQLIDEDGIEGVHRLGIDYELSGVVTDWVRSGRLPWLERLKVKRREELLQLPGIGPRLVQELKDVLGVVDLDGLAQVARDGRLASICGFGAKRIKLIAGLLAARGLEVEMG